MTNTLTDHRVGFSMSLPTSLPGWFCRDSRSRACRESACRSALSSEFGTIEEALVLMLNREFTGIYLSMVDHIERDPDGGRLSRIYYYTLSAVYERPLARTLYTVDREAMNAIMRTPTASATCPAVGSAPT